MSDYKKLRNVVEMKCEDKDFNEVSKCINYILLGENESDKIKKIKSLICHFEGKLNKANYFTVLAVGYALVIGSISVFSNMIISFSNLDGYKNIYFIIYVFSFLLITGTAFIVICISRKIGEEDYKNAFILNVLNFKLDELNNKVNRNIETGKTDEIAIKNEASTESEPDEIRNYREYVVRVYDK